MDGDKEQEPVTFRPRPESRVMTHRGLIAPDAWSDETAEEAARNAIDHLIRSLAAGAVLRTVGYSPAADGRLGTLCVQTAIKATEMGAHAIAERVRQELTGMEGIKGGVKAVSWHLSMPEEMRQAQASANDTIKLS